MIWIITKRVVCAGQTCHFCNKSSFRGTWKFLFCTQWITFSV